MIITTENYPNVMEAVHLIQQETGDHLAIPILNVPDRWRDLLPKIDVAIGKLSRKERAPEEEPLAPHIKPSELLDSEMYSFCNGLDEVQQAIANRDMELMSSYVFLTDFFEDWSYTEDSGGRSPANMIVQKRIEYLEMIQRESGLGLTTEQMQELDGLRMALT